MYNVQIMAVSTRAKTLVFTSLQGFVEHAQEVQVMADNEMQPDARTAP